MQVYALCFLKRYNGQTYWIVVEPVLWKNKRNKACTPFSLYLVVLLLSSWIVEEKEDLLWSGLVFKHLKSHFVQAVKGKTHSYLNLGMPNNFFCHSNNTIAVQWVWITAPIYIKILYVLGIFLYAQQQFKKVTYCSFSAYKNNECIYLFTCMLGFYSHFSIDQQHQGGVCVGRSNSQSSQVTHKHKNTQHTQAHTVGTVWMCPAYRYLLFFGMLLHKATGVKVIERHREKNTFSEEIEAFQRANTGKNKTLKCEWMFEKRKKRVMDLLISIGRKTCCSVQMGIDSLVKPDAHTSACIHIH